MTFVRVIVALEFLYIYDFALDKLKYLPPEMWLPISSTTRSILDVIGLILCFFIAGWPLYRDAKMRASDFKKIAMDMGFVFHEGKFQPAQSLLQAPLLRRGYKDRFGPAITGKHEGVEILLFEHAYYEIGEPKRSRSRFFRTVVVFYAPELHIPEFIMISKGRGDPMLEGLFRSGIIDFKGDSKFSKHYALSGPKQELLKELFVPELRSAITSSKKRWAAAGIDNKFILFADSKRDERLKPEKFVDYFEKTWEIFNTVRSKIRREIK